MRIFSLLLAALFLSACNLSEMAAKLTPDSVEAMAERDIDAVYARNSANFSGVQGELSDDEFKGLLSDIFGETRGGNEISRTLVGANVSKSTQMGKGTSARYELTYEVATGGGFTLFNLLYVQNPGDADCCTLQTLNVQGFDASPQVQVLETIETVSKIIGIVLLALIAGLIFFLVRRSRRKRAA